MSHEKGKIICSVCFSDIRYIFTKMKYNFFFLIRLAKRMQRNNSPINFDKNIFDIKILRLIFCNIYEKTERFY